MLQVVVALVGLMGNMMSVLVLSRDKMKNSFNCLLIILAMFDTVFIILVALDYSFARGLPIFQKISWFLQQLLATKTFSSKHQLIRFTI